MRIIALIPLEVALNHFTKIKYIMKFSTSSLYYTSSKSKFINNNDISFLTLKFTQICI